MKNDDISGLLDAGLIGIPVDCAFSEAINAAREHIDSLESACKSVARELLDRHDAIILGARGTPLGTRHEDYKRMAVELLDATH